jgi:excisionase family DNA binding protein
MTPNLSLPEAAAVWGVSPRTAYRLAALGLIRVARFGRRFTVPAEEVERVRLEGVSEPEPALSLALPRRGRRPAR